MTQPDEAAHSAVARYGAPSRSRQRTLRAAVIVVAVLLGGWLLWAAMAAATPEVRAQVLGFRVVDDRHVQVSVEVVADRQWRGTCTLRAQDRGHETTALTRVAVPASTTGRRVVQTVVKTRSRAVVVTVVGCRAAS